MPPLRWSRIVGCGGCCPTSSNRKAPEGARKLYNRALFDRLLVIGGRIAEPVYVEPFRLVFGVGEFENGSLERETGLEPATTCLGSRDSTN